MVRRSIAALALCLVCASCAAEMRITFIDAGQADAALIQIGQGAGEPFTIIVDGGDGDSDLEDNLPSMMAGDSTVELVVLSHPHSDHLGALDWLVTDSGLAIERIWWGGEPHTIGAFDNFKNAVDAEGVMLVRPDEAFHHFVGASGFTIRVLNNGQEFSGTAGKDINNESLVFQIIYEPRAGVRVTALFPGDIEEAQGAMLVGEFGDELRSDIVKVPHHGSDHLFDGFPLRVAANFAYVSSTGTHRTFKHPRKSALDLYEATAEIFCTCDAVLDTHHITVTVNEFGDISTSPAQPPYLVWEEDSNGDLQQVTVTP